MSSIPYLFTACYMYMYIIMIHFSELYDYLKPHCDTCTVSWQHKIALRTINRREQLGRIVNESKNLSFTSFHQPPSTLLK